MTPAAERARAAIAQGDLISAYDETISAIAEGDQSDGIRHQQVLALARMGDTERAAELFQTYGLDRSDDPHKQAIGARLLKDRALGLAAGEPRDAALQAAADAYHAIYAESGDSYPGINAASLAMLAGDAASAQRIASAILADPELASPEDFYLGATRAEAQLLLGQIDESTVSISRASAMIGGDHGARSTTSRQMKLIANHMGFDTDAVAQLLAPVEPARVMHFCGHIFASDAADEARLRAEVEAMLEAENIAFGYGALAAGADLIIAEALLARGGELHVVLPFAVEDFIAQSVRPAGEQWAARFERCMEMAASRTLATEMAYVGDPQQFAYCTRVAMGLATLRARHLGNEPLQLAVWDGNGTTGVAGTGADVSAWRAEGGRTITIDPGDVNRDLDRPPARVVVEQDRALAAILFTDFRGFSKLAEEVLPKFWHGVMRKIADLLDEHGDDVWCRNSWGDALYAVTSSAAIAAEIALELQVRLNQFDYPTLGIEGGNGMRIGAHFGPAYREFDHITGQMNFYGTEVSRAARIEPVTPPGAVFVTEPFAAILTLEASAQFRCRYVGRIELAKKYGSYPMYLLTRR